MPGRGTNCALSIDMVLKSIKKAHANTHFGNFSEALLACKVLEAEQLKEVARQAAEAKTPLERYLVQKDLVDPAAFTLAAAAYFNMAPLALPDSFTVSQDLLCGKSEDFWIKVKAVLRTMSWHAIPHRNRVPHRNLTD